jgi:GTP-binding protein
MKINEATFLTSSANPNDCPAADKPEYAFIGRSNVGKSSLLNMLCNRKKLAKISGTPGKTRLINHFTINQKWYMVDLPGYGYAKLSKTEREKFTLMISRYLQERTNLANLFVIVDSRHAPQKSDLDFIRETKTCRTGKKYCQL